METEQVFVTLELTTQIQQSQKILYFIKIQILRAAYLFLLHFQRVSLCHSRQFEMHAPRVTWQRDALGRGVVTVKPDRRWLVL
jgi:hypothetical protein